jgi:hypothetical protein
MTSGRNWSQQQQGYVGPAQGVLGAGGITKVVVQGRAQRELWCVPENLEIPGSMVRIAPE